MDRDDLVAHLAEFLDVEAFQDGQPNGVHVEGADDVQRVVTGVSACMALFESAIDAGADTIISHHGLMWGSAPMPIAGPHRRRVKLLLDNDVNLLSYHLPLDAHEGIGNNAVAARELGLAELTPFGDFDGMTIGYAGRLDAPVARKVFVERVGAYYDVDPLVLGEGPDPVERVGIVSGAGQGALDQAIAAGLDAFVTGEVREQTTHTAREAGITFLACGHHATERVAMRELANYLQDELGLEAEFVEVPNPV